MMRKYLNPVSSGLLAVCMLSGCATTLNTAPADTGAQYYGTLEPFAANAVYFVVTDRFADGDPGNNYPQQGGDDQRRTFDRQIVDLEGRSGNIGYLGGDFKGIAQYGDYIREMGFGALWLTPIVSNPDEAFTGGSKLGEAFFADQGKTGYHGYWGVNFYEQDEHLVSPGFEFADLTRTLRDEFGLLTVLDIVCNHGSPSYSMPSDQPMYGEIYDGDGRLVADHQNLHPTQLRDDEPLHAFFHHEPDLAELSNNDETNPAVLDYYVDAYLKWIDQGAAAFRIDTIRHMPHAYWKQFSDRIRERHPGFFMFGESFDYNARKIAEHTYPKNGAISVLDFPGRKAISELFERTDLGYDHLLDYLHLTDGVYQNPYELMTFYDNHDMARMAASDEGFIDAHNWLFTSRGIPVIYYGSEMGFRAGAPEHGGNRDFFGKENLDKAENHAIRQNLMKVARLRQSLPALQRGLQVNLDFDRDTAAFYRVLQHDGVAQTVLVLLNKSDQARDMEVTRGLSAGQWRDGASDVPYAVSDADTRITATIPPHGVRVFVLDAANTSAYLAGKLAKLQIKAQRP
jgi:cyclomaltodextrin glucanotransferase